MKYLILLLFLSLSCFGANPDFRQFNTNQFSTNGNMIGIKYSVINVLEFGAKPYLPPSFSTGAFPTNAVDCSVALSNAFRFASNAPSPRKIYLPNGFYKFTNALVLPPLTSIEGEGQLHFSYGGTRALQNATTVATNNYSVLWWAGSSNGTALRMPYTYCGYQELSNFELCGATNPMAASGQGYDEPLSIEMLPTTAFGRVGIDTTAGTYCGGYVFRDVTITGFKYGQLHGGNFCIYERVSWQGNDMGFVSTNSPWAPDQVWFKQCSIGLREGGLGYFISGGNGWIMEDPSDIDYRTFMVQAGNNNTTVIGGNSEANGTNNLSWCLAKVPGGLFYETNAWQFGRGYFEVRCWDNSQNSLSITGGRYAGNDRSCLVNDMGGLGAAATHISISQPFWTTTNSVGGLSVVVRQIPANDCEIPRYNAGVSGFHAYCQWLDGSLAPYFSFPLSKNQVAVNARYSTYFQGFSSQSTNINQDRWGVMELQMKPDGSIARDWLQIEVATNYSSGVPQLGYSRVILSDPGVLIGGLPGTNITVGAVSARDINSTTRIAAPAIEATTSYLSVSNTAPVIGIVNKQSGFTTGKINYYTGSSATLHPTQFTAGLEFGLDATSPFTGIIKFFTPLAFNEPLFTGGGNNGDFLIRGRHYATNGIAFKTNAAPTSVTVGTTAPDKWYPIVDISTGLTNWVPAWTHH